MKSKKYSRKKNSYRLANSSSTRRRFRGGANSVDTSKMSPEELADYKRANPQKIDELEKKKADEATARGKAEVEAEKLISQDKDIDVGELKTGQDRIQLSSFQNRLTDQGKRQANERESELMEAAKEEMERTSATGDNAAEKAKVDEVALKLRQMERGEGQSNAAKRMSDVQRTAAKVATAEREQELADAQEAQPKTKKSLQTALSKLVKGEDLPKMIENYPDSLNRSIKLKNVKVPIGKRTKKFEDGTSVETNDKRLRRLLSQITQFTEPGDDITLENVDLDFEGTRKMLELRQEYGDKAIEHSFEFISLAIATIATKQLMWLFTMPFTGPLLQVAKEEMNTLMGLFKFNFGLVLQIVETLYESRNRLKRIRDRGSFDKFSVDKDKSEAKISEQSYTKATTDLVEKKQEATKKIKEMADKEGRGAEAVATLNSLGPGGKYDSSKTDVGDDLKTPEQIEKAANVKKAEANKIKENAEKKRNDLTVVKTDADNVKKNAEEVKNNAEEVKNNAKVVVDKAKDILSKYRNARIATEDAQGKMELVKMAVNVVKNGAAATSNDAIGQQAKAAQEEVAEKAVDELKKVTEEAQKAVEKAANAVEEAAKETAREVGARAETAMKAAKAVEEATKETASVAQEAQEAVEEVNSKMKEVQNAVQMGTLEVENAANSVDDAVESLITLVKKLDDFKKKANNLVDKATLVVKTAEEAAEKANMDFEEAEKADKEVNSKIEAAQAEVDAAERVAKQMEQKVEMVNAKKPTVTGTTESIGGTKNKTRAKSGGGGTQLPYDQYADTGYNTGTSFFAFEGDMGGRFDNTFTPTSEQSSFFKSIDYYDKV